MQNDQRKKQATTRTKQAVPTAPQVDRSGFYVKIALGAFLLAALALRAFNVSGLSLHLDELVHVSIAKNFLSGRGPLVTTDNNGILYTVFLLPFYKIFGVSPLWSRLPSVLFGVAALYMTYRMGRLLFNRYVGLLAAFAGFCSLYLTFWARAGRNYAIFGFFYLLLGFVFLKAFEKKPSETERPDFFQRLGLDRRYALLLLPALLLSFLSHRLTFFFIITVAVYTASVAIVEWKSRKWDKYAVSALVTLPFLALMLIPAFEPLARSALSLVAQQGITEWVVLDWDRIGHLWRETPWLTFGIYNGVLRYDATLLYFPALAGFVVAFWLNRRSALWLLSSFVAVFLLMSFVFREPSVPRYLVFIYPYFLIAAAACFYGAGHWAFKQLGDRLPLTARQALVAASFIAVFFCFRYRETLDLVQLRKTEGRVVDANIAQWRYTNWQESCRFLSRRIQPSDVVMSTEPPVVAHYLKRDSVLWFRQKFLDNRTNQYIRYEPDTTRLPSARTLEELVQTVRKFPRGWLLTNFYLDNIMTDERARLFVAERMTFHPEASTDGSVMLFSWDHSQPPPQNQNLVIELGKTLSKVESPELNIQISEAFLSAPEIKANLTLQFINNPAEAFMVWNNQFPVALPTNKSLNKEPAVVQLKKEWLRPGNNKLKFVYNKELNKDPQKGFVVYYFSLSN